jgi:hypothetical protein
MDRREEIMSKHSEIFRQFFEETIQTSCMPWGLEVPDAWLPVVEWLCDSLRHWLAWHPEVKLEAEQVKEKFNTLRFYFTLIPVNEDITLDYKELSRGVYERIAMAETMCRLIDNGTITWNEKED